MYNKRYRKRGKFLFILFFPLLWVLLTAIVMWLWNAILPSLLHTSTITFWQSGGLLLLCRILFGGFHFRRPDGQSKFGNQWNNMRNNMREKWMNMSEEERTNFKNDMRNRCRPQQEKRKDENG